MKVGKEVYMSQMILREELMRRLTDGIQLVDVLPSSVFNKGRLPGAINIPLTTLDATTARQLERSRPVIVYCHDFL